MWISQNIVLRVPTKKKERKKKAGPHKNKQTKNVEACRLKGLYSDTSHIWW